MASLSRVRGAAILWCVMSALFHAWIEYLHEGPIVCQQSELGLAVIAIKLGAPMPSPLTSDVRRPSNGRVGELVRAKTGKRPYIHQNDFGQFVLVAYDIVDNSDANVTFLSEPQSTPHRAWFDALLRLLRPSEPPDAKEWTVEIEERAGQQTVVRLFIDHERCESCGHEYRSWAMDRRRCSVCCTESTRRRNHGWASEFISDEGGAS